MLQALKTGIEYGPIAFAAIGTLSVGCIIISPILAILCGTVSGLLENRTNSNSIGGETDE